MKKSATAAWLIAVCLAAPIGWLWWDGGFAAPLPRRVHSGDAEVAAERREERRQDAGGTTEPKFSALPLPAQAQISAALGRDQSGYHATRQPEGLRMENAGHRLAVNFTSAEVQIRVDSLRPPQAGAAEWRLALRGYGYGDELRATTAVAPQAAANRIEYRRGGLNEWYLNGPLGLEQGFTLTQPPGESNGEPLTLALSVSGNLALSVDAARKAATLRSPDGTAALRYRGLTAYDATGRELPSWLEADREHLRLRVDDAAAQYPLVVDPFIEQARLTASDGAAGDLFGTVAVDGDTIVVGARFDDVGANTDQGSVYVFVEPAGGWSGALTESARLIASDGAANDVFGTVAVSGDTIVVGANGCPNANVCNTQPVAAHGSAYVFVKPAGGWSGRLTEQAKLIASDGASNDLFGSSVAVEGDTIVVTAEWDDFFRGSAYVFLKPAGGWSGILTENAKLIASDRGPGGSGIGQAFGRARIAGDTIVAGALGADVVGSDGFNKVDAGAAYVFVNPAAGWSGTLGHSAKLIASDRASNDRFSSVVHVKDDVIVVGAPLDDIGANPDQGSAYVFVKPATGWSGTLTQQAKLIASDGKANDRLGGVRVNGDTIIVGAGGADVVGSDGLTRTDAGAVYLFTKPAVGWTGTLAESEKLTASDGATGDGFGGFGLGVSGDILVVGVGLDDIGGNVDQGSVYVFDADVNDPPIANAGADQTVECGSHAATEATLDGSASSDPDGDALSYEWHDADGNLVGTQAQVMLTLPLGSHTFTLTVDDGNGDMASDMVTIQVVDTTPPTLALTAESVTVVVPTASATGAVADVHAASGAAASDLCDADPTITHNGPADGFFSIGITVVTITATDHSGNVAQQQFTVHVVYNFIGFQMPLRNDGSSIFRSPRPIPVKFQLTAADGTFVSNATATLAVFKVTDDVLGSVEVESMGDSNEDNFFRFDSSTDQYIYNLSSRGYAQGTYLLRVLLNDGTLHDVLVSVR